MSAKEHHVVSPLLYLGILIALLIGTGVTVLAAYQNFGRLNIVIALLIATIKMTLVILFFMHGKYSAKRTQLVIISGFFWLAIMLGLTLMDYTTRHPEPNGSAVQSSDAIYRA